MITNKSEQVNQDLNSVYTWIEAQPDIKSNQIGVAGFCYGGRAALNYSLHNDRLAATVIFYGSPETDPAVLSSLPGPVLGIFGGADASIPLDQVRAFETALNQAGIPNEITIYADQPHAFVTDIDSIRAGGVQGRAWQQMLNFLEQNLKNGSVSQIASPEMAYHDHFDWTYYLRLVYEHAFGTASGHH